MTRFLLSNRIRPLGLLSARAAALCLVAAVAISVRADDPPGSETPPAESPKTESPTAKTPSPKPTPAKAIWYKPAVATKILIDKGLKRLKATAASTPWVLPDDAKVTEKLADFTKVAAANHDAAKNAKHESLEISGDRETLSKAQARYTELKGYADKPDSIPHKIAARFRSEQEMMQALQQDLNQQVETINKLQPKLQGQFVADIPGALKAAIIDWMLARNNLIMAYNAAKTDFDPLDKQYRALADDPEAAAALRSLGKKNHLGSAAFEQIQKSMAEAETVVNSGEVPFYRQGALDSVGAILNGTTPIVILIQSTNPNAPSWAPADMLAKAGVAIDATSPEVQLTFSGNGARVIKCHQVLVPKLRIGKYVLENLKFLAMPDDAKDLGLELANSELKAYDQTPDRETWLYKFEKKAESAEEAKPTDTKPDEPKPADSQAAKPDDKTEAK
jgi:hypothetical protein